MTSGVIKVKFNREFRNKDVSEQIISVLLQHLLRLDKAISETVYDKMYFIRFNSPDKIRKSTSIDVVTFKFVKLYIWFLRMF